VIRARLFLVALQIFLLSGFLSLTSAVAAESAEKTGKVKGASFVNLRSGPDLRHRPMAALKEGDVVTVEEELESWYRVSLADGQKGYVHRTLLDVVRDPEALVPFDEETKEISERPRPADPPPRFSASKMEPSGLSRTFRWEGGLLQWLIGLVCVFLLGWIFGGNYYLKRDRVRTSRLRL
jgi:SH3-like domain-containing protein